MVCCRGVLKNRGIHIWISALSQGVGTYEGEGGGGLFRTNLTVTKSKFASNLIICVTKLFF